MENIQKIKSIIEALLIVSENGLTREELRNAISDSAPKEIEESITLLKEEYSSPERGFNIAEIAGKCRIVTKPEYMPWIANLYEKDVDRLTGPSLETLAIIAYKQPGTRAEVEAVRGVNVGGVLKTLLDKDLIKVKGRRDAIGRPLTYGTTDKFLEIFGLNSLDDLPGLRDFTEEDLEYGKPQETVEVDNSDQSQETESLEALKEEQRQDVEAKEDEMPEAVKADEYQAQDERVEEEESSDTLEDETEKQEAEMPVSDPEETEQQEELLEDAEDKQEEMPQAENIDTDKQEIENSEVEKQEKEVEASTSEASEPEIKESDNEFQKTE